MTRWAAINTITRRIARGGPAVRQQLEPSPQAVDLLERSERVFEDAEIGQVQRATWTGHDR
jgi:hypothetical protein